MEMPVLFSNTVGHDDIFSRRRRERRIANIKIRAYDTWEATAPGRIQNHGVGKTHTALFGKTLCRWPCNLRGK